MIEPRQIADQLLVAEQERKEIDPFTDAHPDLDVEAGYEAQRLLVQTKVERGLKVVGAKVGLTSRAKQKTMGISEPIYGMVFDTMLLQHGEPVELDELIHPRVEPEIAFLLGRDLVGPVGVPGVLAATEVVFGAVDVIDSRYRDYKFKLPDVTADNCSAGKMVLGPVTRKLDEVEDLRLLGCVVRVDGDVVATAAGAAVIGHPAAAVAWLANTLAARGEHLPAGSLLFAGGLTDAFPLQAGRSVTAEFDGLGSIEVFA
jgi:2-oxo-3-hexenedioate decarboxylase